MASKGAKASQVAAERPANSVVFDLLAADGDDVRRKPLRTRRRRLESTSRKLLIARPSAPVTRVLELTGLDRLFGEPG